MSRVEGNRNAIQKMVEMLESDGSDCEKLMGCCASMLKDISISLAIIADEMREGRDE